MGRRKTYSKYHVDLSQQGKLNRIGKDYKTGEDIQFDSLLEKQFYEENIVNGMECGEIVDYDLQKKYQLQPSFKKNGKTIRAIDYVADAWVLYPDGTEKVFDVKGGLVDPVAKIKQKMMYYKYPDLDYTWVTYSKSTGWINYEEYEQLKRKKKRAKA